MSRAYFGRGGGARRASSRRGAWRIGRGQGRARQVAVVIVLFLTRTLFNKVVGEFNARGQEVKAVPAEGQELCSRDAERACQRAPRRGYTRFGVRKGGMEPTGIEPVTSALRTPRS